MVPVPYFQIKSKVAIRIPVKVLKIIKKQIFKEHDNSIIHTIVIVHAPLILLLYILGEKQTPA